MAVKATAQETVFDLTDAYSIMLTSESYTFNGNTSGVPAGKTCSTQVVAYLGGTPMKSNISKVTCPTGISVSLKDNNTIAPTITFTTTATVTKDCEASISVTVDDVTISKKFSFAVAKTGSKGDTGAAGNGIKSISYYYARSSSQTAPDASKITGTSLPTLDATNKYLWQKEVITYTNSTSQTTVVLLAVYGNTGAKGDKGNDGTSVTIKSQAVTYQASSSGTTIPSGTWSQGIPTVAKGQYLWTRTVITFSNDATNTSYSVGYMGTNGQNGSNGSNGKDGKGIKSTEVTYQIWANGTSTPNGTWSTSVPATSADQPYLWTRTVITYTDNSTSTSYSVGSTLKGVNVGGRNLIIGSSNADPTKWTKTGWSGEMSAYDAQNHIYKITAENGWSEFFYTTLQDYVGKVVTLHLLAQNISAETTATDNYALMCANSKIGYHTGNLTVNKPVQDEWIECSVTFTLNDDGMFGIGMQCQPESNNLKTAWLIKNLKLELGNIATDWTPAPEDVDADISNAQNSANQANANASAAKQDAANANSSAQQAGNTANTAKKDAESANSAIQAALKQIAEIQTKSNEAKKLASDAWNGVSPIAQVVKVDDKGLKVLNSKDSTNYAQMQDVGFFIFVSNNQVAEFGENSKMRNIAIQDYMMFGSHRAETTIIKEEESTAFYWIGDVK